MANYDYKSIITSIPDYPKPGITFRDVTTLFADPQAFANVIDDLSDHFIGRGITKIVAPEARGFMTGAPVAYRLNAGFVPARKPGKLPRETMCESYDLEYGSDELHIHTDAITSDDIVLIIDDLVATGGTAAAAARMVKSCGATVAGYGFITELDDLNPRPVLLAAADVEIVSLVHYKGI